MELAIPAPPTDADLAEHLARRIRKHALERERDPKENVAAGDRIRVDVIGWCEGSLIPFSVRWNDWIDLEPMPELPGLAEALVGSLVEWDHTLSLVLPPTHRVVSMRGKQATYTVRIGAAREVFVAPNPTEIYSPSWA